MKTRNKKGFTIVELVIVIAVIGILTAILVPVFINLTNKANEASDNSLVKNLNTALRMEEQTAGHKKAPTLQGAIDDLENQGYLLENLQSKSGLDLLWDQEDNQFLLNKDGVAGAKYWKIVDTLPGLDQQVYSYYAGQHFSANTVANVKYGFDVGDNENIDKITFENTGAAREGTISIRTNGGELTINAPQDSVNHYGKVDSLNIKAIKSNSHHEYGVVKFIEISAGRIAMENGSKVDHIHVNAKVVEEVKQNEFNEVIIAKDQSVDMPKLSRDDVEIASTGTLVVALQAGTEEVTPTTELDYVWLTKQGIYEQIKVSDSKESAGNVWVNTSDKSAETKEAAQQIANNIDRDDNGKVNSTVTIEEKSFAVDFDEDRNMIFVQEEPTQTSVDPETGDKTYEQTIYTLNDNGDITATVTTTVVDVNDEVKSETTTVPAAVAEAIVEEINSGVEENVEKAPDAKDAEKGAVLFDGGFGTEKDPFKISTKEQFANIGKIIDTYNYFEMTNDIDLADWESIPMNGNFNGNGFKITSLNKRLFIGTYAPEGKAFTVSNVDITVDIRDFGGNLGYFVCLIYPSSGTAETIVLNDVDVHGFITGTTVSTYLGYGTKVKNCYFNNCESDVTLQSSNCAGFVCHVVNSNIHINDSKYTGKMFYTGTANAYYTTNWNNNALTLNYSEGYDVSGIGTNMSSLNSAKYTKDATVYAAGSLSPVAKGECFSVAKATGANYAIAQLIIGARGADNKPNYTGVYINEELEPANDVFSSVLVKNYYVTVNSGAEAGITDNTYNVVNSAYGTTVDSAYVVINQYNAVGNIVRTDTISIL